MLSLPSMERPPVDRKKTRANFTPDRAYHNNKELTFNVIDSVTGPGLSILLK